MNEHLGEAGTEQFTITTTVNGEKIRTQAIHDPFIRCHTTLRGFRHAWNALTRGIEVVVFVNGTEGAQRAIMTLNPRQLHEDSEQIFADRARSREAHARGEYGPASTISADNRADS